MDRKFDCETQKLIDDYLYQSKIAFQHNQEDLLRVAAYRAAKTWRRLDTPQVYSNPLTFTCIPKALIVLSYQMGKRLVNYLRRRGEQVINDQPDDPGVIDMISTDGDHWITADRR